MPTKHKKTPQRKPRVYIAGPYSRGCVAFNVRNAVMAAESITALGCIPFVPHLNHLWHLVEPHEYEFWMEQDLAWLPCCDVVLRLPGHSPGADREEVIAKKLGIQVVRGMKQLQAWLRQRGRM